VEGFRYRPARFVGATFAAVVNAFVGLLVAWVLVRYRFPGRRLFDALVDLPFALPTAVAGIALTALYAPNGWLGQWLVPHGIQIAYAPPGVILAMVFVGFPFVVRTLQPVLESLDRDVEEAAESLGASHPQTFFLAGNIPMRSEIAPLLIVEKLEEFDYAGAAALGMVMLIASFVLLIVISLLQRWSRRWAEHTR
jgi:sulfate transport system permease protein